MRTFIAIDLSDSVRAALEALSQRLRRSDARASWIKPERMHLTLRFLGNIEPEDADRLGGLLAERYAGLAPFKLRVTGAGAFPNVRKPSVVWAGVGPLDGGLAQAQVIAEECARTIGAPPDNKAFHPHLTLARIRDPRSASDLAEYLARESDFDGGEFAVRSVSLFSSRLTPKGPIYTRLRECPLS